jgi:hypothetical protein
MSEYLCANTSFKKMPGADAGGSCLKSLPLGSLTLGYVPKAKAIKREFLALVALYI